MRHPGPLILSIILWVHPLMTLDRLLLASVFTSYMIGRHTFTSSHSEFAKNYFTEIKYKKTVQYEYVHQNGN